MSPKGSIEHSATSRADSAIAEVRNTTQGWLGRMVSALQSPDLRVWVPHPE